MITHSARFSFLDECSDLHLSSVLLFPSISLPLPFDSHFSASFCFTLRCFDVFALRSLVLSSDETEAVMKDKQHNQTSPCCPKQAHTHTQPPLFSRLRKHTVGFRWRSAWTVTRLPPLYLQRLLRSCSRCWTGTGPSSCSSGGTDSSWGCLWEWSWTPRPSW